MIERETCFANCGCYGIGFASKRRAVEQFLFTPSWYVHRIVFSVHGSGPAVIPFPLGWGS